MNGNHKSNRKRRRMIFCGVAGRGLAGTIVGLALALRPSHEIDPSKLAQGERGDIARSVVATGKIEPLAKVELKSKASGIVKEIFVDYGDRVRKGQVLVELDKEELSARVREARASHQAAHQAAQAAFERNKVEAEGPDLPFLQAGVERARQLYEEKLIAKALLEDAGERAHNGGR